MADPKVIPWTSMKEVYGMRLFYKGDGKVGRG